MSFAELRDSEWPSGVPWSVVMKSAFSSHSNSSSEPQIKRKKLSLAVVTKDDRIAAPTSSNDLKKVCEGFVP